MTQGLQPQAVSKLKRPPSTQSCHFSQPNEIVIPTFTLLSKEGSVADHAQLPKLDQEQALRMLDCCIFTQILDERMLASQRQGRISFYMTCTGEEAAVIGSAAGLEPCDMILGQYREHAALRYRGFSTVQFMHQMFSNEHDLGKGRQMPIHYGSKDLNYQTISSPLGTQIPQAAGVAYAQKLKDEQACTLCYFGEGAASEGDFHAGMNMAAALQTPTIFFCRNNAYAISTPVSEQYAGDGIAPRGMAYGMPCIRVDGNDILAVMAVTQQARAYVLSHQAPILIEAMTYRVGAHSSSDDPTGYRSKEEEDTWRAEDPVGRFKLWMLHKKWATSEQIAQIEQDYKAEILAQVKQAESIPLPHIDTIIEDVYQDPSEHLKEQLADLKKHIKKYPQDYPKTSGRISS